MRRPAIDPDDLAFLASQGLGPVELAQRVGVQPTSLVRLAQRHGIPLPAGWTEQAKTDRQREQNRAWKQRRRQAVA